MFLILAEHSKSRLPKLSLLDWWIRLLCVQSAKKKRHVILHERSINFNFQVDEKTNNIGHYLLFSYSNWWFEWSMKTEWKRNTKLWASKADSNSQRHWLSSLALHVSRRWFRRYEIDSCRVYIQAISQLAVKKDGKSRNSVNFRRSLWLPGCLLSLSYFPHRWNHLECFLPFKRRSIFQ